MYVHKDTAPEGTECHPWILGGSIPARLAVLLADPLLAVGFQGIGFPACGTWGVRGLGGWLRGGGRVWDWGGDRGVMGG